MSVLHKFHEKHAWVWRLVVALAAAGADIGALVAYLTSWSVLGLTRIIMWELPFMGTVFTATRFAASLVLPFVAGLIARRLHEIWCAGWRT